MSLSLQHPRAYHFCIRHSTNCSAPTYCTHGEGLVNWWASSLTLLCRGLIYDSLSLEMLVENKSSLMSNIQGKLWYSGWHRGLRYLRNKDFHGFSVPWNYSQNPVWSEMNTISAIFFFPCTKKVGIHLHLATWQIGDQDPLHSLSSPPLSTLVWSKKRGCKAWEEESRDSQALQKQK